MKKMKKLLSAILLLVILTIGGYVGIESEEFSFLKDAFVEEELVSLDADELAKMDGSVFEDEDAIQVDESEMEKVNEETFSEIEAELSGDSSVKEDGTYTSKEEVASYIHKFGKLPSNFITKNKAKDLGWDSKEGNLDEVAPGKSIGGDRFGNYEGMLPEEDGRTYRECDIDYEGGFRNEKRIVYSNDGLIYYTEDHYETFTQLY